MKRPIDCAATIARQRLHADDQRRRSTTAKPVRHDPLQRTSLLFQTQLPVARCPTAANCQRRKNARGLCRIPRQLRASVVYRIPVVVQPRYAPAAQGCVVGRIQDSPAVSKKLNVPDEA